MAAGVPARLTAAQGRRFGLTVGPAFIALSAVVSWRADGSVAMVLATVGAVLLLAGLAFPTRLGPVERGWMRAARAISFVTTPIVMGIMFLFMITPVGILRRAWGGNPLVRREQDGSFWVARPESSRRSSLRRQF